MVARTMLLSDQARVPSFFLLSFLIGVPRLFTLTVSDSLFLSHYPAALIPMAYLGRAILIPLLGLLLFQAERFLSNRRVLTSLLVLLTLVLGGFLVLFRFTDWNWPYLGLLIWVSAEWTLTGMVFWNTANRHFTLREGKRVFGIISTGEVVAAILGGLLVPVLLNVLSPEDLLLLSIGGHLAALVLVGFLGDVGPASGPEPSRTPSAPRRRLGVADLLRSPYLLGLFGLASLDFLVHYFTDNAFFLQVQAQFPDSVGLTAFLGLFLGAVGAGTLVFKLFLTKPLIESLGLGGALALGPASLVVLGLSAAAASWAGAGPALILWLLVGTKFLQMLYSDALFTPAYYILFQPLPVTERTRIQNFAEAVPGRIVGGLGGLLILGLGVLFGVSVEPLAWALVLSAALWWVLTRRTIRDYRTALQRNTEERSLPGLPAPKGAGFRAADRFEDALARLSQWARISAAWAIEEGKSRAPWMDGLLKEENDHAVGDVLASLQKKYPSDPLAGIREALASPSPALRSYAVESLENILEPVHRDALLPLLEGRGPEEPVSEAFRWIVRQAASGTVRPLFRALADLTAGEGTGRGLENLLFLKSVPLFQEVPYWYLPMVFKSLTVEKFPPGAAILTQGDPGESLYLIRRGQVRVHLAEQTLALMGPGSLFGEYAVFDASPRSASVTSLETVVTYRLDGPALFRLMGDHPPVLAGIAKLLCLRLYDQPYWNLTPLGEPGLVGLASSPLFHGLGFEAAAALQSWGTTVRLTKGEVWTREGDLPPGIGFVLSGGLFWEGIRLDPGTPLDDVAPLAQRPCRGTCRAEEGTEVFLIDPGLYLQSLALRPEALSVALRSLVRRLKTVHEL